MIRKAPILIFCLAALLAASTPAGAQPPGQEIYMKHCFWCHGEEGRGDGPAAVGMFPRPRDFVGADYRIRSTAHGQLPTDEDLRRAIAQGLPGTPMPGWESFLSDQQIGQLVEYLKSFSPRFQTERPEPMKIPTGTGSVNRGEEVYGKAKCFMCHGESGRGDGGITAALNYQWGLPYPARDLTRGWTFRGGHEPGDIYLRITGGLNGTPMGPYQDLLDEQDRWDLAYYVASLDLEPIETSDDFVVAAAYIDDKIPKDHQASQWQQASPITVPLAGQVVLNPPTRWSTPTIGTATVRALWNGREIGLLLEWNDPTGPGTALADSALLQFATEEGSKPYFLFGDAEDEVQVWRWQAGNTIGQWTATGSGTAQILPEDFQATASWKEGHWYVVFRRPLSGKPRFEAGRFVPILFSLCDGGNGEAVLFSVGDGANGKTGNVRAISTWLYVTLQPPPTIQPWLWAMAAVMGAVILEIWILRRMGRSPAKLRS